MTHTPKNDGGPAFPAAIGTATGMQINYYGMSLRDYFAAQAMQGMLAHSTRYQPRPGAGPFHAAITAEAYEIADAMLAARQA